MRACGVLCVAVLAGAVALGEGNVATRVALADLEREGAAVEAMMESLRHSGVVQVAEVPGLAQARAEALALNVACGEVSQAAVGSASYDGTHRRSLGTVPGEGFAHGVPSEVCERFDKASTALREATSRAARAFANKLGMHLPRASFLATAEDEDAYETVDAIVRDSQQLEHFHAYNRAEDNEDDMMTVDLHMDQGMFIAFTPALMYEMDKGLSGNKAGSFLIELPGGRLEEVDFADNGDVIVFMLGDGVNQYVNPALENAGHAPLRATPHAMQMPSDGSNAWRSWYGRMYLPPAHAINSDYDVPFGEMRKRSIEAGLKGDAEGMAMGCSGDLFARELHESTCEAGALFCWHRCMNLTDYDVSDEICEAEDLELACADPEGNLWASYSPHNGQVAPRCVNVTEDSVYLTYAPTTEGPTAEPSPASTLSQGVALVLGAVALALF
ncbi:Hypothetical Protein FCC1311_091502 [Hondaea fermentalgiana]|uniref:Uncharacterized protein n=1 Tax=Hondaea fermentalgiana TaxID=2315210 RepID=A0A2R5GY73_9STRA|nr:Hypothetical Protein FCC1311_091502 [Hondaea fermentalgiana]|eukprot:GBG32924.1 Hypothetical Protein FCC1311_091502 [Hondaea fermentalgiana]